MEGYDREFWQFSDQLRLQTASFSGLSLGDSIWSPADNARAARNAADPAALFSPSPMDMDGQINAKINTNNGLQDGPGLIGSGKLAFGNTTTNKADRYNNVSLPQAADAKPYGNLTGYGGAKNNNNMNMNSNFALNKMMGGNYNSINSSSNFNSGGNGEVKSYFNKSIGRPANNNNNHYGGGKKGGALDGKKKHAKNEGGNNNSNNNHGAASEKRFKTLPASEALPRNEAIGGYIFVCNNDTMEENLKRQLFGLPSRYRDSVRAIRPGLPLFLYNYSTHQLHGIFEAASFGGANIDPAAWEDKKCPGESRFPAQVPNERSVHASMHRPSEGYPTTDPSARASPLRQWQTTWQTRFITDLEAATSWIQMLRAAETPDQAAAGVKSWMSDGCPGRGAWVGEKETGRGGLGGEVSMGK